MGVWKSRKEFPNPHNWSGYIVSGRFYPSRSIWGIRSTSVPTRHPIRIVLSMKVHGDLLRLLKFGCEPNFGAVGRGNGATGHTGR